MEEESLVKTLNDSSKEEKKSFFREIFLPALLILGIILAGGVTGWFVANKEKGGGGILEKKEFVEEEGKKIPQEMGIKDPKTFKDQAFGRIEKNDNQDVPEGTHKLIRPGGPSQTAYLTSSVVDLDLFVGKCVEVLGETFKAQKAAWLMDVGWVKVLKSCPEGI